MKTKGMKIISIALFFAFMLTSFSFAVTDLSELSSELKAPVKEDQPFEKPYLKIIMELEEKIAKAENIQDKCRLYAILGDIYMDMEEYGKAKDAAEKILEMDKENISGLSLMGRSCIFTKNFEESEVVFEKILEKEPRNMKAAVGLLYTKSMLGKDKEGEKIIEKNFKGTDEQMKMHYIMGIYYYNTGKYDKAVDRFRKVLSSQPDNYYLNYFIARSYYRDNKYKESAEYYEKAMEERPYFDDIYYPYLYSLLKLKKYEKIDEFLAKKENVPQLDTDSAANFINLYKLMVKDEYGQAFDWYKKLFFADPFTVSRVGKSIHYIVLVLKKSSSIWGPGNIKFDEETEYVKKLKKEEKKMDKTDYYTKLYEAYVCTDERAKALEVAKELVKVKPQDINAALKLAYAYLLNGDFASSEKEYEGILAKQDNPEALKFLALTYDVSGYPQKAVDRYNKILEKNPKDIPVLRKLVNILHTNSFSKEKGKQIIKNIYGIKPSFDAAVEAAGIYIEEEKYEEAENCIKKVIKLDPENVMLNFMLFVIYSSSDQKERADSIYKTMEDLRMKKGGI
ncbi:MAG: tetratricopeptide repeat protein [Armatimonadota bacterium]